MTFRDGREAAAKVAEAGAIVTAVADFSDHSRRDGMQKRIVVRRGATYVVAATNHEHQADYYTIVCDDMEARELLSSLFALPTPPAEGDREAAVDIAARFALAAQDTQHITGEAIYAGGLIEKIESALAAKDASARLAGAEERQAKIVAWLRWEDYGDNSPMMFGDEPRDVEHRRALADAIENSEHLR